MSSKSDRNLLCNNNFFYQSSTATHLQKVFICLIVRIVWLDCFVAVVMTHFQLTFPLVVFSKKTLFNCLCAFFDIWRVSNATKFWKDWHSLDEKDIFFLSDNDISAAFSSNRETWVGDFGEKLSPKVFFSATIKSNQLMSPWWPMKCYSSSGTITYNFWKRTWLSVDVSRNVAQGEQTVSFDFELAFLQVRSGTVNCYAIFVRWKGLKT